MLHPVHRYLFQFIGTCSYGIIQSIGISHERAYISVTVTVHITFLPESVIAPKVLSFSFELGA